MKLYIHRNNLSNIYYADDKELLRKGYPSRDNVLNTLKHQFDVQYCFSEDEVSRDEELYMMTSTIATGMSKDITHKFEPNGYTPFNLKSNIHTTHPDKQAIFLVNSPAHKVRLCQDKGGLLIFGEGEEFDLFKKIFLNQSFSDFHRGLKIGSTDLIQWKNVEPYALPFTDIILVDNYICHCDDATLNANLMEILAVLHRNKQLSTNIVLFTDKDRFKQDFLDFRANVRAKIQAVTGYNPNFTIVTWRKQRDVNHYAEHDRTIFTNYLRLKSGDTFNYWNSAGVKITSGRELDLYSLAKRESFKLAADMIEDLNTYLTWCRTNNQGNIQGDKISNFLTF